MRIPEAMVCGIHLFMWSFGPTFVLIYSRLHAAVMSFAYRAGLA